MTIKMSAAGQSFPGDGASLSNLTTLNPFTMDDLNATTMAVYKRDEQLAKMEIAVQIAIMVLATVGNGTVLLLLGLRYSRLTRMNLMIMHLSLADLFVAFFNVLPQLMWDVTGTFKGGLILCKLVTYFQVVAMYASSYVLVTTAIDRWLVICHPLTSHTWTNRKLHLMVGGAWLLSLIFASPQFAIFSYVQFLNLYDCRANYPSEWSIKAYVTWFTAAIYIIPLLLLILIYGRICFEVWESIRQRETFTNITAATTKSSASHHHSNNSSGGTNNGLLNPTKTKSKCRNNSRNAASRGMSRAKKKTVKLTLTVIACYLLCWGPFFITQMWAAWDPNAPYEGEMMTILVLLASLNSCVNPFIFFAFSLKTCRQQTCRMRSDVSTDGRTYVWQMDSKSSHQKETILLEDKEERSVM